MKNKFQYDFTNKKIEDNDEKIKILKKLNNFLNYESYSDSILLSFDVIIAKYGHSVGNLNNFFTIRFEIEQDYLKEIESFLISNKIKQFYFLPIRSKDEIYLIEENNLCGFSENNNLDLRDFILMDKKFNWVLVIDEHRKLSGIGDSIIKKMNKNISTNFGKSKVMFVWNGIKHTIEMK